jgi:alkylhydroperoxidase/carboxymuconolactone decarboxylase family protein
MGEKFFGYCGAVFTESSLSIKEKSAVALAVAHTIQYPCCIAAYSTAAYDKGYSESKMAEAAHVAAAIRGGASLVHSVHMINKVKKIGL